MSLLLSAVLAAVPGIVRGIEVGSTVSCSLTDLEYLDISSLECVRCDDDRCASKQLSSTVFCPVDCMLALKMTGVLGCGSRSPIARPPVCEEFCKSPSRSFRMDRLYLCEHSRTVAVGLRKTLP